MDATSCTLAWGRPDQRIANWIGSSAPGLGAVEIHIDGRVINETGSWHRVVGLKPDTPYPYELAAGGLTFVRGTIRTWPVQAGKLTFFVIGDWGNGSSLQSAIATRMETERVRLESSGSPVRFVLSTGDNIYGGGSRDQDWDSRFFVPYASTLKAVPFYAVPGNHDGNESEQGSDLPVYLDNFFSPSGPMSRWYRFQFADLAQFFALDSTTNQFPGPKAPAYLAGGEQSIWLNQELGQPGPAWRIAFFHHPMFTAGPRHPPALPALGHWLDIFQTSGVSAVFSGHEHNLQFSDRSDATRGIQFVLSGAGGELRRGNVRSRMRESHIAAWAAQAHFLVVEIEGETMKITPVGDRPVQLRDSRGTPVAIPFVVPRRHP